MINCNTVAQLQAEVAKIAQFMTKHSCTIIEAEVDEVSTDFTGLGLFLATCFSGPGQKISHQLEIRSSTAVTTIALFLPQVQLSLLFVACLNNCCPVIHQNCRQSS